MLLLAQFCASLLLAADNRGPAPRATPPPSSARNEVGNKQGVRALAAPQANFTRPFFENAIKTTKEHHNPATISGHPASLNIYMPVQHIPLTASQHPKQFNGQNKAIGSSAHIPSTASIHAPILYYSNAPIFYVPGEFYHNGAYIMNGVDDRSHIPSTITPHQPYLYNAATSRYHIPMTARAHTSVFTNVYSPYSNAPEGTILVQAPEEYIHYTRFSPTNRYSYQCYNGYCTYSNSVPQQWLM